jgi:hypothetical protein
MGTGKSTQAIAVHHAQHTLNAMHAAIRASPEEHFDIATMQNADECPKNEAMYQKYGFDCPCWPQSPTYFVKGRLGCTVMMVPLGLLDVWKFEHTQCSPCALDGYPIRLVVAHHSGTSQEDNIAAEK